MLPQQRCVTWELIIENSISMRIVLLEEFSVNVVVIIIVAAVVGCDAVLLNSAMGVATNSFVCVSMKIRDSSVPSSQ